MENILRYFVKRFDLIVYVFVVILLNKFIELIFSF